MFIPGEEVAEFFRGIRKEQIQPAGVDLTVAEIFEIDEAGEIDFSNEKRKIPKGKDLQLKDKLHILPGSYRINYGEAINIPKDSAGIIVPRSSLMRMGATVVSALWDPGYRGRGQGLMVVFNPKGITVHKGARVAQMFLVRGRETEGYSGKFQGENL